MPTTLYLLIKKLRNFQQYHTR